MDRRRFLGGVAVCTVTLSGCLGSDDGDDPDDGQDDDADVDPEEPVAAFDWSPEEPTAGEEVTFDAEQSTTGDSPIVTYRWTFGNEDEATLETDTVTHTFESLGSITVVLEVEDEAGATDTASEIVEIGRPAAFGEALGLLEENALHLDELTDIERERTVDDIESLTDRLDEVASLREELEGFGNARLETDIEALELVSDFQRSLVEHHETGIETVAALEDAEATFHDGFSNQILDAADVFDVDPELADESAKALADTETAIERKRDDHDDLETRRQDAANQLEDPLAYTDTLDTYLRHDEEVLEQTRMVLAAHQEMLVAYGETIRGWHRFENAAYEDAADAFERATDAADRVADEIDPDIGRVEGAASVSPQFFDHAAADEAKTNLQESLAEFRDSAALAIEGDIDDATATFESALSEITGDRLP